MKPETPSSRETQQAQLLKVIVRHPKPYLSLIFQHFSFRPEWIEQHHIHVDWTKLSANTNLLWNEEFLYRHAERWHIEQLSQNPSLPWSYEFIKKYPKPFYVPGISYNKGLPWSHELIDAFRIKWDYNRLIQNEGISWTNEMLEDFDLIGKNLHYVNGKDLWTHDFIDKIASRADWTCLGYNRHIHWNPETIERYHNYLNKTEERRGGFASSAWTGISSNSNVPWSIDFIERHRTKPLYRPRGLHWKEISKNTSLPWNDQPLLERYDKQLDWKYIGLNSGVHLTEEQFDRYQDRFPWWAGSFSIESIAANPSLPWSVDLIRRYQDKWQWWFVSRNDGIKWDEALIHEFKDQIRFEQLTLNPSAPWSLSFLIEHQEVIARSWTSMLPEFKSYIWTLLFKDLIDESFLESLFDALNNPFRLRQLINIEKLDDFQKDLLEFTDTALLTDTSPFLYSHNLKALDTFLDEFHNTLYRLAAAEEHELPRKHDTLQFHYAQLEEREKDFIDNYLNSLIPELILMIHRKSPYLTTRNLYLKHRETSRNFQEALKKGIHYQPDHRAFTHFVQQCGARSLELTGLIIALEEARDTSDVPF